MELSERCIAQLEKEGFAEVYEEKLAAHEVFPLVAKNTALFVTEGSLMVRGHETTELLAGDRYRYRSDVTALTAGVYGCQLVIGEGYTS